MATNASMPPVVHAIPLDVISADAMTRDRTLHDADSFSELKQSIALEGVRCPIEVYEDLPRPDAPGVPLRYGLIAGYRRLQAVRQLRDAGCGGFGTIPAFIRPIATEADGYRLMVEENLLRADVSAWERASLIARAVESDLFDTLDAAADTLFRSLGARKRERLRLIAGIVPVLRDHVVEPERLSQRQLLRLSEAVRAGFGEVIVLALDVHRKEGPAGQWAGIQCYLDEHAEESRKAPAEPRRPGRPRRVVWLSDTLTVRRDRTHEGYILRFAGNGANSALLDRVLDDIELLYRAG